VRALALLLLGSLTACGPPAADRAELASDSAPTAGDASGSPRDALVDKVWRVTAPAGRPQGSLYVFLSNGTLIMTSCVETYRLAQWTFDPPASLTITEDPITRYGADIVRIEDRSLAMRLKLRSENVDLVLELVDTPYVCPDLPR
jgi:hypothetical protein